MTIKLSKRIQNESPNKYTDEEKKRIASQIDRSKYAFEFLRDLIQVELDKLDKSVENRKFWETPGIYTNRVAHVSGEKCGLRFIKNLLENTND